MSNNINLNPSSHNMDTFNYESLLKDRLSYNNKSFTDKKKSGPYYYGTISEKKNDIRNFKKEYIEDYSNML